MSNQIRREDQILEAAKELIKKFKVNPKAGDGQTVLPLLIRMARWVDANPPPPPSVKAPQMDCEKCSEPNVYDHGDTEELKEDGKPKHLYCCENCGQLWRE